MKSRSGIYTDRWYLERRIYMGVGINLTVASVLSLVHSAWWLLFPAFVGAYGAADRRLPA
jgi:hypothetical protein